MTYNTNIVIVHLGDPFENPHEERFLNKLRRDLIARGVPANIIANVVAPGRNQRQIDFLVLTKFRLVHVELKALSATAPTVGKANGPWVQHLVGGGTHEIRPNPYRQAHEGTYALSDAAGRLIHAGQAASVDGPFYKRIDTVVCIDPSIPAGSRLDAYVHVEAIGYEQLLERLTQPGPRPPWNEGDWEAFCRQLGVYREEEDSPTAVRRRSAAEALDDYARRFDSTISSGLHPLVEIGVASGPTSLQALAALESGQSVTLCGLSGTGKTHTARHLASELSRRGALVLWLRANEYEKGRFGPLLGKAAAPYSSHAPTTLAARCATVGRRLVIVVDGLNECPENLRSGFLEQLSSFTLRYPASLLVTTTDTDGLAPDLIETVAAFRVPLDAERTALLESYGASNLDHVSSAFNTAFELSVAAQCHADLAAGATVADLYDAYLRQLCPSEVHRSGLRAVATALNSGLRTSMRTSDAIRLLGSRSGANLDPAIADAVLASKVLSSEQGRIRFTHEQLGRFLAAEHLVLSAPSTDELAASLLEPGHRDLAPLALGVDHDPARRAELLRALADPALYLDALNGFFGAESVEDTRAAISGALAEAAFTTTVDNATFEPIDDYFGRWHMNTPWTPAQVALLRCAGLALRLGQFVPEVTSLLDRTDVVVAATARHRRAQGINNPLTAVISSTYVAGGEPSRSLAATLVIQAEARMPTSAGRDPSPFPIEHLLADAGPQSWGRLYVACEAADHRVHAHQELIVDLLRRAWEAGSYHLRLHALQMATRNGRGLDPATADEIAETLHGFRTHHPFLQSSIVEALAACGRVVSDVTESDIAAEVEGVLSDPFHSDKRQLAAQLVGLMFEDEDLVGPVWRVIDALPARQRALLMAIAASVSGWMFRGWALRQSIKHVDANDSVLWFVQLTVLRMAAVPPARNGFMMQEEVEVHIVGVRGLARLSGETPPQPASNDERDRAWGCVDQLLAGLEGVDVGATAIWSELLNDHAAAGVQVLWELRFGGILEDDLSAHAELIATYPGEVRRLLEWGLTHRDSLSEPATRSMSDLEGYIVGTLGQVGDAGTARLLESLRSDNDLAESVVTALRYLHARQ